MDKKILSIGVIAFLGGTILAAQDWAGDWQGTLAVGAQKFRHVLHVTKAENGTWKALFLSLDQGDRGGVPISSLTLQGSQLQFSVELMRGSYTGIISADGRSITGTWTQGRSLPLEFRRATPNTLWKDPSPHSVQLVKVDQDVNLEVLDWGGSGRTVVLLAGLGNTAHVFDEFAPKLTPTYHVYGMTRRGFGASSLPTPIPANYAADRLGDDVLAVCAFLSLHHPVLIGHSIAGEELSSIGSRHPERVAGLVYLEAGYAYAYYDRAQGDPLLDSLELQKKLEQFQPGQQPADFLQLVKSLLQTDLPQFEKDLREMQKNLEEAPPPRPASTGPAPRVAPTAVQAIHAGEQKYSEIRARALAIYAVPHDLIGPPNADAAVRSKAEARDEKWTGRQAQAFERGVPSSRVVRLPHANHYVFQSNEADVLREVNTFMSSLPSEQP